MNRHKLLVLLALLSSVVSVFADDQGVADDVVAVDSMVTGSVVPGVTPVPVSFSGVTDMLRNMTPEQQKDFDEYLKTVEDMYSARGGLNTTFPQYDSLLDDSKLNASTKKDLTKDTEGFFVEEAKRLLSFKDLVGGVPDGIMLTAQTLIENRATRAAKAPGDSEEEHYENASYRLLLYGPPGTGKTILAEAFAREIGAAFMRVKGTDFVDGYIATGTDRVKKCFQKARDLNEPVVVFIDEVDAIGRERTKERNDEYANTLVALIQELDHCEREAGDRVFIILATNMFSTLDSALRSRFSNTAIEIKTPSSDLGMEILEHYLNKAKCGYEPLSRLTRWRIKFWTRGFAGRDYRNMINKAILYAKKEKITKDHLLKAMSEAYASRIAGEKDKESWFKKFSNDYSGPVSTTASAITYASGAVGVIMGAYWWIRPYLGLPGKIDSYTQALFEANALSREKIDILKALLLLKQAKIANAVSPAA